MPSWRSRAINIGLDMPILQSVESFPADSGEAEPIILAEGERWYAVHTLPVQELRAESNLANQDFRIFLPKRHKTIRHARRLLTVEAAFFPRYLFVVMDMTRDQWRRINGTFGVARLIMRGEEPQPVPVGIVESLQVACDPRGIFQHGLRLKRGSTCPTGGPRSAGRCRPGPRAARHHGPQGVDLDAGEQCPAAGSGLGLSAGASPAMSPAMSR